MKKAILKVCTGDVDTVGEHKRPLKLSGRNSSMEENARTIVSDLPSSNDQLVCFYSHAELIVKKSGNRERNPHTARTGLLDVVRRIPIARGPCQPVDGAFDFFEAKQEGVVENG